MKASRWSCNKYDSLNLEDEMKSLRFLALVISLAALAALPLNAATTGHFERTLQVNGQWNWK